MILKRTSGWLQFSRREQPNFCKVRNLQVSNEVHVAMAALLLDGIKRPQFSTLLHTKGRHFKASCVLDYITNPAS